MYELRTIFLQCERALRVYIIWKNDKILHKDHNHFPAPSITLYPSKVVWVVTLRKYGVLLLVRLFGNWRIKGIRLIRKFFNYGSNDKFERWYWAGSTELMCGTCFMPSRLLTLRVFGMNEAWGYFVPSSSCSHLWWCYCTVLYLLPFLTTSLHSSHPRRWHAAMIRIEW